MASTTRSASGSHPKCRTCQESHEWPRGQNCPRKEQPPTKNTEEKLAEFQSHVLDYMKKMDTRMENFEKRRRSRSIPSNGDSPSRSSRRSSRSSRRSSSSSSSRRRSSSAGTSMSTSPSMKKCKRDSTPEDKKRNHSDRSLPPPPTPSAKGKKSGRDKTAQDVVTNDVIWPHYFVSTANQRPAQYDQLSIHEFVFGYTCIQDHESDPVIKRAMSQHLRELMLDMKIHKWYKVRAFHALVLSKMEAGQASWFDLPGIQYLRLREGYLPTSPPRSSAAKSEAPSDVKPCNKFQNGACNQDGDHNGLKHCCAFCFKAVKRAYRHAQVDCKRKLTAEERSKNGTAQSSQEEQ